MAGLPVVLAGPIVRRVAEDTVSVWIATRDHAEVELKVWSGPQRSTGLLTVATGDPVVASGTATTKDFGSMLHIAVVTAKTAGTVLMPGSIFSYDVRIGDENLRSLKLLEDEKANARLPNVDDSAPLHLALGYELDRLPSFATPAPILTDLCLAHASCRRTNAEGPDALAFVDDIIENNFTDIAQRPQQLFLTGDQIYADDLGTCLQKQLNEIGVELLGFTETLPIDNVETNVDLIEFPARRRRHLVREIARFTTVDGMNHLLSYGEFLAMHLLVWSPRMWRPLTTADDVFVASGTVATNHLQDWEAEFGDTDKWKAAEQKDFEDEAKRVEVFRAAVPRVARALANCATYMMFDDHEVTDDWYLSESWRTRVLTAPFGRAVVRNAYMAYTVCQGWGNDPAAFNHTAGPLPKNEELLDTLEVIGAFHTINTATKDSLDTLLGLAQPVQDPQVTFNYAVPSPIHMVRVLDTRTRRTYKGRLGPPKLLGTTMDKQLPPGPLSDARELLVVISPVPVLMPRIFDTLIQPLAAKIADFKANVKQKAQADKNGPPITGNEARDVEGWGMDEDILETLIQRLGTYSKVLVLSGDVHFSSSVALDYWKGSSATVTSRIVQLTSSAARNGAEKNLQAIIRAARFSQQLLRNQPFERLAWSTKSPIVVPTGTAVAPGRRSRMRRAPSLLPAAGWPAGTTIPNDKPPEWRWRVTALRDDTPRSQIVHPERLQPPLPTFDAGSPVDCYRATAGVHAQLALSTTELLRTLVFGTNIGLIRIEGSGANQGVVHELWTMDAPHSTEGGPFTHHRSPLSLTPSLPPVAPQLQVEPADG
jgi:hypothetical protein